MSLISEFSKNKNKLRAAAKSLSIDELDSLSNKLAEVIEQRRSEAAAFAEENKERLAQIERIKNEMIELGISAEEMLGSGVGKAKRLGKKVAAKYRVTDAAGIVHEWTGRGRTPKVFADVFSRGKSKTDVEI
jgi:DNA-binding protein H-NS